MRMSNERYSVRYNSLGKSRPAGAKRKAREARQMTALEAIRGMFENMICTTADDAEEFLEALESLGFHVVKIEPENKSE